MTGSKFGLVLVALGCASMGGMALAAPYANVSSTAQVGSPVTINGGGFVPGALVNLRVRGPGKAVTAAAVVAGADGSISYTLVAAANGPHVVQLSLADGRAVVPDMTVHASR